MGKIVFLMWGLSTAALATERADVFRISFSNGWGEERLILLTGFGPFGSVHDNPSGRIVHALKKYVETHCPVGEGVVDSKKLDVEPGIIESVKPARYETILSLGVHAGSRGIRLETAAQNRYDDPDTGKTFKIDPRMKLGEVIYGPSYPTGMPDVIEGFPVEKGTDYSAGTYVCNDTYFRLCRSEGTKGYFVHIPNVPKSEDLRLSRAMGEIACRVFAN